MLEKLVCRLIHDDGSFAQYSVNYHRVLLDTLIQVEYWRKILGEQPFSTNFYRKVKAATKWLYTFTIDSTGHSPNIGANDGARLYNLTSADYSDKRPSIQLASQLFFNRPFYPPDNHNEPFYWLKINPTYNLHDSITNINSSLFRDGGFCYLSKGIIKVFIRFPMYYFRPSHADALHMDLWIEDLNIFRDTGSFSYNTDEYWQTYFTDTKAHNTIEFDGRNQMPKLSRFLFGQWLKTSYFSQIETFKDSISWSAEYRDNYGASHSRQITVFARKVIIEDTIEGVIEYAILRFHLAPLNWIMNNYVCSSDICDISISSNSQIVRSTLIDGFESKYYMEKSRIKILEIEVNQNTKITTIVHLKNVS